MRFLSPLFFAGLAALAIPVLIHLINRERRVVVEFPSLMFLQKIPYKSVRRQKLRHLLLLALRCLALAILVAAFARPFFDHRAGGAALTGARERVVLLDRSYSMGYGDHWKRAQAAARDAVSDLGGGDRATLITFASDADAASPPTADHAQIERAVAATKPGSEGTRYAPAFKLATQVLLGSNLPRREVVLISDFQNVGWSRRDDVHVPPGTVVKPVDVSQGDQHDMAVAQVTTDRDREESRARATIAARITNTAAQPQTVDATLEIGGRTVETKRVTVPAKGAVQARFAATAIPFGATRGTVRIPHDALPANDAFNFTLAADEAVSVLIIEPPNARANQSLFLRRALEIGERPSFRVDLRSSDAVTTADLATRSLVVLNEVTPPAGAVGTRLRELVTAGAGLLIVPGPDMVVEKWSPQWRALFPVKLGPTVDRTGRGGGTLASVNYGHPVFELFSAPRSGDFSTAHMFRYRAVTASGDSGVLARFDDGSPALVEHSAGVGKVVLWASSMDEYWTDLPLQPVFLPFIHELAKYAGRYSDARPWFTAGDVLDLSRHGELTAMFQTSQLNAAQATPGAMELVLESPSGKRTRLDPAGAEHLAQLHEQGFYELRAMNTPVGSGRPVAVNVDLAESDLSHFDPKELVAAVTAVGGPGDQGTSDASALPEDVERRQTWWWYLLIGVLIFMVAETILSNRLSRAAS